MPHDKAARRPRQHATPAYPPTPHPRSVFLGSFAATGSHSLACPNPPRPHRLQCLPEPPPPSAPPPSLSPDLSFYLFNIPTVRSIYRPPMCAQTRRPHRFHRPHRSNRPQTARFHRGCSSVDWVEGKGVRAWLCGVKKMDQDEKVSDKKAGARGCVWQPATFMPDVLVQARARSAASRRIDSGFVTGRQAVGPARWRWVVQAATQVYGACAEVLPVSGTSARSVKR